jgi:hypothetical protein
VSGRTTPICRPDPADPVSPLSWDIVDAMSVVKELTPSPEGTVAEPPAAALDEVPALDEDAGVDEDADEDDEQPAATMAVTAATASQPNLGSGLNVLWPCERECHPPCLLLPRSIPYPFRHNAIDTPTRDAGQHTCPYGMKGRSWER